MYCYDECARMLLACWQPYRLCLRRKLPHKFENAWFKLPYGLIVAIVLINMAVTLFFCYSLFATLTLPTILASWPLWRRNSLFYARVNQLKRKGIDLRGGKWLLTTHRGYLETVLVYASGYRHEKANLLNGSKDSLFDSALQVL